MTTIEQARPTGATRMLQIIREERLARSIEGLAVHASGDYQSDSVTAQHSAIRDEAQKAYERLVSRGVAVLEHDAVAEIERKRTAEEKKKHRDELLAMLLLMFGLAAERIYRSTRRSLAAVLTGAQTTTAPGATTTIPTEPAQMSSGAISSPMPGEAQEFGTSRATILEPFWTSIADRLEEVREESAGEDRETVIGRLQTTAETLEETQGPRVGATEAQACYGSAQIRLLKSAGFATKVWATMEDERVRTSHRECANQGEVPMDGKFVNGLRFPGDPSGGPEEVCNCRCWLVGGRRIPGSGHLAV